MIIFILGYHRNNWLSMHRYLYFEYINRAKTAAGSVHDHCGMYGQMAAMKEWGYKYGN